jgi:hypothetical protein
MLPPPPPSPPPNSPSTNHSCKRFNLEMALMTSPLKIKLANSSDALVTARPTWKMLQTVARTDQIIVFVSHGRRLTQHLHLLPVRAGLSHRESSTWQDFKYCRILLLYYYCSIATTAPTTNTVHTLRAISRLLDTLQRFQHARTHAGHCNSKRHSTPLFRSKRRQVSLQ